ncbi:MAG: PadR family transcriptional regulator [Gemmatimonadota bacterium]|nr:PadR family transcriptional regulator [Gemmatimonadota bacterium]
MNPPGKVRSRTHLEITLMCLMARAPVTGGWLVRFLRESPLMGRGKSPGAVYPALARLRDAGLVKSRDKRRMRGFPTIWKGPQGRPTHVVTGRAAVIEARVLGSSNRRWQEYALTQNGLDYLRAWAVRPVRHTDLLERPDDLLLQFMFLPGLRTETAAADFLGGYASAASDLYADVADYRDRTGDETSISTRWALDLTLELLRVRRDWARAAERGMRRPAMGSWR